MHELFETIYYAECVLIYCYMVLAVVLVEGGASSRIAGAIYNYNGTMITCNYRHGTTGYKIRGNEESTEKCNTISTISTY